MKTMLFLVGLFLLASLELSAEVSWQSYEGPNSYPVLDVSIQDNGTVYASGIGFFKSNDKGTNWECPYKLKLVDKVLNMKYAITRLINITKNGTIFLVAAENQLLRKKPDTDTFEIVTHSNSEIETLCIDQLDRIFFTADGLMKYSTDMGDTWLTNDLYTSGPHVRVMVVAPDTSIYVCKSDTIYQFTFGTQIEKDTITLGIGTYRSITFHDDTVYLATSSSGLYRATKSQSIPVLIASIVPTKIVFGAAGKMYAIVGEKHIYYSNDYGISWIMETSFEHLRYYGIAASGSDIYVTTTAGLYYSSNNGNSYELRINGIKRGYFRDLFFTKNNSVVYGSTAYDLFKKTNNEGAEWVSILNKFPLDEYFEDQTKFVPDVVGNLYCIMRNEDLYFYNNTLDTGINLNIQFGTGLSLESCGDNVILYSPDSMKMIRFKPDGTRDTVPTPGLIFGNIEIGTGSEIILHNNDSYYLSLDCGYTFNQLDFTTPNGSPYSINDLEFNSGIFYANVSGTIYSSVDKGKSWKNESQPEVGESINNICLIGNYLLVVLHNGHVYYKATNESNYTYISQQMEEYFGPPIQQIGLDAFYRPYFQTTGGVFRTDYIAYLNPVYDTTPSSLNALNAFPNPSNSIVTIETNGNEFSAKALTVTLSNANGFSLQIQPSNYLAENNKLALDLNGFDLATGIYFVTVNNGIRTLTQKIVFVKE